MRTAWRLAAVAVVIILATGAPVRSQDNDLTGTYACEGQNPNGDVYRATVQIVAHGDVYRLRWAFEPTGEGIGVGLRQENGLSVVYQLQDGSIGLAAFRLERAPSRLIGIWTIPGIDAVGTETLTKTSSTVSDPVVPKPAAPPAGPRV